MALSLIEKITGVEEGKSIRAALRLSGGESYLADHFPGRPVMPGVLMLEALVQAASWLAREKTGFRFPVTVLAGVRSMRYGRFVVPGDLLEVEVDLLSIGENGGSFRGRGYVGGKAAVSGRFDLEWYCPAGADDELAESLRERYGALKGER